MGSRLRSWLFVPGHRQKMIEKALGLEVDVIIFDLEDGVPVDSKVIAREQVATALGRSCEASCFVRTHCAGHCDLTKDLEAVLVDGLDGVVLPKMECASDVDGVSRKLAGDTSIVGMIESATGLVQASEIASSPGLVGLMFGAEDFAQDLGILATRAPGEMVYARSSIVVAAASAGKFAVDKVFLDVQEQEGLVEETRMARELGFVGKALIHPAQVGTVHSTFEPSAGEIDYARKVVAAFEEADGQGPVAVDGKMVDPPVLGHSKRVLGIDPD